MYKSIMKHPYSFTGIIFLIIVCIGGWFLDWREENFAYLLLLYFIVTLGIRLDDISKQIGSNHSRASQVLDDEENIIGQLGEIKTSLLRINVTLNKILDKTDNENR
jgi:hypothetical protein